MVNIVNPFLQTQKHMYSSSKPMKLVAITSPTRIKFETETINRLFNEGLDELHIHKPQYNKEVMKTFIGEIDFQFHERLVRIRTIHWFMSLI